MAVLKRQRANGEWEYVQNIGQKTLTESDLREHTEDTHNPHQTSKEHVGLGNLDNKKQARSSQGIRLTVSTSSPTEPKKNDLWIEVN